MIYSKKLFTKKSEKEFINLMKTDKTMKKYSNLFFLRIGFIYIITQIVGVIISAVIIDSFFLVIEVIAIITLYFFNKKILPYMIIRYFKTTSSIEITDKEIIYIYPKKAKNICIENIKKTFILEDTIVFVVSNYKINDKEKKIFEIFSMSKSMFNSDDELKSFILNLRKQCL